MKKNKCNCDKCKMITDDLWTFKTDRIKKKLYLCWGCYNSVGNRVFNILNASTVIP